MSGGGYRGKSFGPRGAHYNNLRPDRHDAGRGGRSRGNNNRHHRNYSRANFDNSPLLRRGGRSQNDNWSSPRSFSRWDHPSNNQQSSVSSPSSSSSTSSTAALHNQSSSPSPWSQNHDGPYQNRSIRFQYTNDSQHYYNRGGRGYFPHGGHRFPILRGSQNFFSPYYSTPYRDNAYIQHDREVPPLQEEPAAPLLGSAEERQQKITEAADELKRKLLFTSVTTDDVNISRWDEDDAHSKSINYDESNVIKLIPELKHGPPELNLTPNDLKDIGKLKDKGTIDPIVMHDCIPADKSSDTKITAPIHDNIIYSNDDINTKLIVITATNVDISDKSDNIIDEQAIQTPCSVDQINNSEDSVIHTVTAESFKVITTVNSNTITENAVTESCGRSSEFVQAMIIDDTSNIVTTVADTSDNNKLTNTKVPDLTVTNSSITESLHTANDNRKTNNMNISTENKTQQIPYLSNFTVQIPSKKKELNLIQFLEEQVALSKNKSPLFSNDTNKNNTKDKSKVNSGQEKNNQSIPTLSIDYSQDNSSEYCKTIISRNFSEPSNILQPPPLPPSLPQPSYESTESCENIVPEHNSMINPSNISNSCGTFHPSSTFDSHLPVIPTIISTSPVVNSSINISAPLPGYSMGHQGYVPIASYGAGMSLAYPPVIPALEYVSTQTAPPLPPSLPHSPPILHDVSASNINEDDDVLGELKKAMEFAKQCMIMGNDNDAEEEDIGFPTFPDLPPIMPETAPPENPKVSKKSTKNKKLKQGMFGPHLEAIAKAKEKSMNVNVETNINSIKKPDEQTTDDPTRRKIVFNLNSQFKMLNKNEDVWIDESREEVKGVIQRKFKVLAPVTVDKKHENSKSSSTTDKIKESDKTKESEKHKESERIKEAGNIKELERTKESKKTKEPEKNLKRDNKSESNNHRKSTDLSRANDKDRYETKNKNNKSFEYSSSNNITMKNLLSSPTLSRKSEKTKTDNIICISEKNNATKVQSSPSNKSTVKITAPTSLKESSWKDRVIGRFLKMSKNDIQNMINNSSLRKFDIAMQHLVKEKKSSLSMEMRNHEDEKMKTSTYDNEDFMSQLQAILDPAATVDITNLPTNFIHQLSEVLHLEPLPGVNISNTVESDKNNEHSVLIIQEPSTSSKIDPKLSSESSRCVETNIPIISTYDMSKSQKIDNSVSKDTMKNKPSTVVEATICTRAKIKRGQVNKKIIQSKQNKVTPLSVPLASSGNGNQIEVDDPDVMIVENVPQTKSEHASLKINTKISTTAPSVMNTTSTVVIERLSLVDTPTTTTTTTTTTSAVIPRIETPIVTRVARQVMELDKLFTAGISKAKAACTSVKATNAGSTIDETILDTRMRKVMQRGTKRGDITESTWPRKGIQDADVYRNLTKEEYEAQYGESSSPNMSFEDEYRKIAAIRSHRVSGTVRDVVCHTTHLDKSAVCEFQSPLRGPPQNMLIQTENGGAESDSQYVSDTSSSSSSNSNSDDESPLIDVSKVLKFIKEREKMAKKKSINEEIRDEVAAEIDRRRKEKISKHKSHKMRAKKREKRKKEKKIKKKKPKKKRRHKSHHLIHSEDNIVEKNELPLRLLNEHEIKREPSNEELPKTIQEVPRATVEPRRSIHGKKILTTVATSNLVNKSVGTEASMTIPQDSLTIAPASCVPSIISPSNLAASTFKTNPMLNSPSLIVTVMNTNVANSSTLASSTSKTASIVTSPLRTVTAVTLPSGMTSQSSIHLKTKAQLKQMPETIKSNQNKVSKIIEPKIIEQIAIEPKVFKQKLTEPVSSTSENQIINSEQSVSLSPSNISSISTAPVITIQTKPKKLDIKTYHERAFQRKLKEQKRMSDCVENPSQLTQNLLSLPTKLAKNKVPTVDGESSSIVNQTEISVNDASTSIIDEPNGVVMNFSSNEPVLNESMIAKNSVQLNAIDRNSEEINQNQLNPMELSKIVVTSDIQQHDEISEPCTATAKVIKNNVIELDHKFINIKSEGGKELKLREKVKKRPIEIATLTPTAAVTLRKVSPQNRQKKSIMSIDNNIELTIDNSLSSVNIQTDDGKDNYGDNNSSETIETDALRTVQKETVVQTNEPLLQVNDAIMTDEKLPPEVNSIKNTEENNSVETLSLQSEVIENKLDSVESQNDIKIFSHYFKFTKGLISDDLPDSVPKEGTELETSPFPLPQVVGIEKVEKTEIIQITPGELNIKKDDETTIATSTPIMEKISETDISLIAAEDIPVKEAKNHPHNTDNLLEVMVPSEVVSNLFKDEFDEVQSSTSMPIISDKNIPSPLSVTAATEFNSLGTKVIIDKVEATELLNTTALSTVDATISSTYDLFRNDSNKTKSYDQLTLDELSDISMDGSLCNPKESSQEPIADTELLSEAENNIAIANLLGKDLLLIKEEKEKDIVTFIKNKIDDCHDCDVNKNPKSITYDITNNQVLSRDEISTSKKISPLNERYKEYSQRPIVLLDRISSIEESQNAPLDDSISFSNIKSSTPKLIEMPVLNDNDVMTESTHNNHEIHKTSEDNNLLDVVLSNDAFVAEKEKSENVVQTLLNNSSPRRSSLSNDNTVHSSSVLNEELIEVNKKEITGERLPSLMHQVPSKLCNNDNGNDNDDDDDDDDDHDDDDNINDADNTIENDMNDNMSKITEKENSNCRSAVDKVDEVDDELILKNLDDFKRDELSTDFNQPVIESPTSTTRNIESNLSGHDESDRSSSEARSVEPDRMQREMSFEPSTPEANSQHTNRYSLKKISKSSTPTISHKKHKRHRDRKEHKLTLERVEDAIVANVVNLIPKPTTKDAVMSRMQEIDIAIQQLMNEKMRLYQMLQTDEWPVSQSEDTTSEVVKFNEKPYSSPEKSDRSLLIREPRIVVSRLNETVNVKRSAITEIPTVKSQISSTLKNETSKTLKNTVKGDDKCSKNSNETLRKISKKRKHHYDQKDSHKYKEIKVDQSIVKKRFSSGESSRQKNKSQMRIKNSESGQRKPVKLSQLLAREFKPKASVEKHRSQSPAVDDNSRPNSRLEGEQKNTHTTTAEMTSPSSDELLNEVDSSDILWPKNTLSHDDHNKIIYSDDCSSDVVDNFNDKQERSTGLSLLEQSIKREMAAKKVKTNELKSKLPSKLSEDVSTTSSRTTDADSLSPPKSISNKKQHRKKHKQNTNMKSPNKNKNHVLEVIDAVAKNRINDLYTSIKSPEKKKKILKKSDQQLKMNKHDAKIDDETAMREESLTEKTKFQVVLNKETEQIKSTKSTSKVHPVISPLPISSNPNEYKSEETNRVKNKRTKLDTVDYDNENKECKSMERDNTSKKYVMDGRKVDEVLSDVANDEKNVMQSPLSVVESKDDAKIIDNNPVIISLKDKDELDNSKNDDKQGNDMQKTILEDWPDSPDVSGCELNQLVDANSNSGAIEKKNKSDEITSFPVTSAIDDFKVGNPHDAPLVIGKPVSGNSTTNTTIKPNQSISLDKMEILNDSMSDKNVIENLINEHSSIKERDYKPKRSKSVEKEIGRAKSTVKELDRSKFTTKDIGRPKSTVKELEQSKLTSSKRDRSKSAVKEFERSKSTVKEHERSKLNIEKVSKPKSTVKDLERAKSTVKELERPKLTVKEPERTKSTVKELERSKSTVKELERPKSTVKELERPRSTIKELERPKSTVKELERPRSTVKELERPKSTVKELERPKSTVKELESPKSTVKELEVSKLTVKELERSKSTVKELERSKSSVKEIERSKSSVTEVERSKSKVKELDPSKSTTKELERSKSTVKEFEGLNSSAIEIERPKSTVKELERSKSTVNELEDVESNDDNDEDNESTNRKRGRTTKRGRQSSCRRRSRQSNDSLKTTSRSRSHSNRMTKSPSSHDRSTPDIEQKSRPVSGSSSSSISSKRKFNFTSANVDNNATDKNNSIRKGRKRKYSMDRTHEQMINCKVRLVDCKSLYLRTDILERLGISRINSWTPSLPRETTPEKSEEDEPSIIFDEDKNRSDDESMEIIQVDESIDLQNITSPASCADIIVRDPLSLMPRLSPEYINSPRNEDITTIVDLENENEHKSDADIITSDNVEVLTTRTLIPVNNSSTSEKNDNSDSQTMQYTVHKGPILDIKVFGDSFLAASEDGAIYRYCQRSNGILNIYKGHDAAVTCLYVHEVPGTADSGNTRWNLFSGSLDATLRCYDIVNGSLERHIADVGSPIQCMDQAWGMIFVGTKSGHISRYDIKSGCLREDNLDFSDKPVLALRASTEGVRRVLIVASRNQPITIRDAQNGLYLRTISGQRTHTVYSLMRDRNLVYCGTSSTSIPVFDFISGEQVLQYTAGVGIVCMRLYRQLLFAGCYDGNIYVFDTKNTKLVCSIPGPGNMLLSMEIVDDKIIAGSKDRRLHAWQMPIQARTILAERA